MPRYPPAVGGRDRPGDGTRRESALPDARRNADRPQRHAAADQRRRKPRHGGHRGETAVADDCRIEPADSRRAANAIEAEWISRAGYDRSAAAVQRCAAGTAPADCVLFSSTNLGETALEAFNQFGQHVSTSRVPALLLLGTKHSAWSARAKTSPLHAVVNSPFTMQTLREVLERVLNQGEARVQA